MQLITLCIYLYGALYVLEIPVTRTPVLTVESPESFAMLTAAGNRQLKKIRLNGIPLYSQNLHVKFQLSVLPLLSPISYLILFLVKSVFLLV